MYKMTIMMIMTVMIVMVMIMIYCYRVQFPAVAFFQFWSLSPLRLFFSPQTRVGHRSPGEQEEEAVLLVKEQEEKNLEGEKSNFRSAGCV